MLSVGVDVGTTRTKAIAIGSDGATRAIGASPTPWSSDGGRLVLDPDALRSTVDALIARLLGELAPERFDAIGFTSIAESGFLCEPDGFAVLPATPWSDPAGAGAVSRFTSEFGADHFARTTGLGMSPTPSIFKLREVGERQHWGRPLMWLSVAEWLAVQYGAAPHSERSLASRTGLINVTKDRIEKSFSDWVGISLVDTPLVWAGEQVGEVRLKGPLNGAVVVTAGHDHLCAAIGAEATLPGDVLNSFGTAEAYIGAVQIASSPSDVLNRQRAGLETGFHVIRDSHSLIVGAPHGGRLAQIAKELMTSTAAIEAFGGPYDLDQMRSQLIGRGAVGDDAVKWADAVWTAHIRSLELAKVMRANSTVCRVVGTGGWLQSKWIRGLKYRDLTNFIVSPREETAARGAAVMAAAAVGVRISGHQ